MANQRRPKDLLITCLKTEGNVLKFWALPLQALENVKSFENLLKAKDSELTSARGPSRSDQAPIGSLWIVKSKIKGGWCRARVLSYQSMMAVLVQLIDYGNEEVVPITHFRTVDNSYFALPGQALECILADVVARGSEWAPEAIRICEHELLFNTLSGHVVSKYLNTPVVRVAKKGETQPFVQRLINQDLAAIREEPACQQPAQLAYRFCNMDQNTIHMVKVSCIESLRKFYVQLTAAESELMTLMNSINSIPPEGLPYLKSLAVNSPCLAQLSATTCFYRALVLSVQRAECKVFFVDYGYMEMIEVSMLRQMLPTFMALPAQAISCSLPANVNVTLEEFTQQVNKRVLECHVISRTPETYVVKLMKSGVDIFSPILSYNQTNLNVGTGCEVTVSYVNDISEFYIQLNQYKDLQTAISSILNSGHNFIPISFMECTPGAAVCVKFSEDGLWYRAKIISVQHESDISVFFVDFGNYDSVSLSAVRKLSPELMKFPIQAFKCYLFDTPVPEDQKTKDDAFDLFEQLTGDNTLTAHIKAFTEGSSYGVVLYNQNSKTSVNDRVKSLAMSIPKVPINEVESIYITSFESPSSFFAQLEKLDSEQLDNMQSSINEFYSSAVNSSFVPPEGSLVCAKFDLDESYYRARVEKCLNGSCQVFFVDYGNREVISTADVHPMDIGFTKYPEFGVQCALLEVPDPSLNDQLKGLMLEHSFQARMVKQDGCKWAVSLTERFPANEPVLQLLRKAASMPRSIHGQGFSANKERSYNTPSYNANSTRHGSVVEPRSSVERDLDSIPLPETKNFKEYSSLSIPKNAFRNVYVSHVVSPSDFYCQIEEDSPKLETLMKAIAETYSRDDASLQLLNYSVDAPCCAMFEDEVWYRGKITQIHDSSCDVFFVDYGNTDVVSNSKIKKLTNDLFRLPVQALQCKVFNVSPKGSDWNDEEINAFLDNTLEKSFVAQFVECDSNGVYAVNLVSIGKLQHDTFNLEFVGQGFGKLQDASKAPAVVPKPPAVKPKSHLVPASVNLPFTEIQVSVGGRKSQEPVTFTFGLNPGEVYCQLKASSVSFNQMMTSLQDFYNKLSNGELLVDRPEIGMVCIAQFHLDNAWYRAKIQRIESSRIYVFYVDYGNTEAVDKKKLRSIVEQDDFTTTPMQAIKCRIRGIKPPGQSWIVNHNLSRYFEGDAVCDFIEKLNDCCMVDVTCNGKNVAELLIKDKLALPDGSVQDYMPPVVKTTPAFKQQPAQPKPQIRTKKLTERPAFLLGQLLSVTVSFVESPRRFWCQVADEAGVLDELMADIETHCQNSPDENLNLSVGDFCLSQYYVDEAWYRAEVTECLPSGSYKVFFFDYGNAEEVTQAQIKAIPDQLLKLPAQCFECCLQNCPSKTPPEMKDLFQGVVDEAEEITAKIEKLGPPAWTVTLLYDKEDQEVNISVLLFGESESANVSVSKESFPKFLPPDIPLGLHEGYVSVVNSPHDFFIQMAGTEDTLADLSANLAELCEASTECIPDLCVGYACCAKYSEDNNWYRAEVTAVHDSTVDVYFVDYGNEDTVDKASVRRLSDEHLQMPPLSMRCKLNGVGPVMEGWTQDAINAFQEMLGEDCLGITFISKDIPAPVNITKDDKEVSNMLVDMELAIVETCAETDEAYAEDHLAPPVEDPLSSLPSDQSYPKRKVQASKLSVKICFVDNCQKFYVMPVELSTELDTVMTTLELLYSDESKVSSFTDDPKVSMPCVAKYSEDEAWYRALITSIDGDIYKVTFVDYGNSELTTLENLRPITPELVKIPPIAIEVSLHGIEAILEKEAEIVGILSSYCDNETELEMDMLETYPCFVKLSENGDLGSMLVENGLAQEKTVEPITEAFEESSKMLNDASLEFKIEIHKRLFTDVDKIVGNVKFCEIENDYVTFYVVAENLEDELQNLQEKLQSAYSTAPKSLPSVSSLDFCCTKYLEDQNWYRAQVLFCDKDKVKVRFIDYGNCETVDQSDIFELLPDFTVEHQFSVKCILYGLKVYNNKEVELQNRLDDLVYHDLVELKLCTYSHAVSDPCITSVICGNDDISEIILDEKLVYKHYVANLQLDKVFQAIIVSINMSIVSVFPVHLSSERDDFHFKLQESCKDLNIFPSEISTDQLYAAKHENEWYRVLVIDNSSDDIQVHLVDFGSTVSVPASAFVLLPGAFCHQPLFLQSCLLEPSKIKVEDLVMNSTVSCEVIETDPADQTIKIRILEKESVGGSKAEEGSACETITDVHIDKVASEILNKDIDDLSVAEGTPVNTAEDEETVETDNSILNATETKLSDEEAAKTVESEILEEATEVSPDTEGAETENCLEKLEDAKTEVFVEGAAKVSPDTEGAETENKVEKLDDAKTEVLDEAAAEVSPDTEGSETENHLEELDYAKTEVLDEAASEVSPDTESAETENHLDKLDDTKTEVLNEAAEGSPDTESAETENHLDKLDDAKTEVLYEVADLSEDTKDTDGKFDHETPAEALEAGSFRETAKVFNGEEQTELHAGLGDEISAEAPKSPNDTDEECASREAAETMMAIINTKEEILNAIDLKNSEENSTCISDDSMNTKTECPEEAEDTDLSLYYDVEDTEEISGDAGKASISFDNQPQETTENLSIKDEQDCNYIQERDRGDNDFGLEKKLITDDFKNEDKVEENKEHESFEVGGNVHVEKDLDWKTSCSNLVKDDNISKPSPVPVDAEENASLKFNVLSPEKDSIKAESHVETVFPSENLNEGNFDSEITELVNSIDLNEIDKNFKEADFEIDDGSEATKGDDKDMCKTSEAGVKEHDTNVEADSSHFDTSHKQNCSDNSVVSENNRTIPEPELLSGTIKGTVIDIAISDGSVIFAVQPLKLQEEFQQFKASLQEYYSSGAENVDSGSDDLFCIVSHNGEWCRGKILHKGGDDWSILLTDYGKCISANSSDVKCLASEHFRSPPFIVWCTLASAFCSENNSDCAIEFLQDSIKDCVCDVQILEKYEPYKVTLLVEDQCLVRQLLKEKLISQKLPMLYLEPGFYMAKVTHFDIGSCPCELFVNPAPFLEEIKILNSSMHNMYKVEDSFSEVEESSVYSVFYNGSWYRAIVLSSDPVVVSLVDTGEVVSDCKNFCFLLPEHCLNPSFAIKCKIPSAENISYDVMKSVQSVFSSKDLIEVEVLSNADVVNAVLTDKQVLSEILGEVSGLIKDENKTIHESPDSAVFNASDIQNNSCEQAKPASEN